MRSMNVYIKSLILLAYILGISQLFAQERRIQIKAEKEVNGVMTKIDTTIVTNGDVDMEVIMKELGLEGPHEYGDMTMELEGVNEETRAKIEAAMEEGEKTMDVKVKLDEDGEKSYTITINGEEVEADGEHNIFIKKIGGDENSETHKIWVDEDGNTTKLKSDNVFFFSDEELTDEEKAEIEKMKEQGKANMFFFKEDNNETLHEAGDHTEKHFTIDVKSIDGDGTEMIKVIKINCFIEDLHFEDEEALRKAGLHEARENNLIVDDLSFYPNPNDGRFNLGFETKEKGDVDIRIVDIQGKGIYRKNLIDFQGNYKDQIDISANPQGVYFLSISQNGKAVNKKLVIE